MKSLGDSRSRRGLWIGTPVARGVPTLLRINSVVSALESASLMVPALPERPADRGGGLLGSLPARERVLCVDALFFLKWRPGNRSIAAALKARYALASRLPSHRFRFVAGSGMRAAGSGGLRCGSGAGESGGGRRRGAGPAVSFRWLISQRDRVLVARRCRPGTTDKSV